MPRSILLIVGMAALAACGGSGSDAPVAATTRDSAGVTIMEYPADAFEKAPLWELSQQPLTIIGGDPDDTELDLSTSQLGALLSDNRIAVVTFKPAQLLLFSEDGATRTQIGHEGEGPGEYRLIARLEALAADTLAVYEAVARRELRYLPDGTVAGSVQFPFGDLLIPAIPLGHLADGTYLFQTMNPLAKPPVGADKYYRLASPILAWREGQEAMDTLFQVPGALSVQSTVSVGTESATISRPLAYASQSFTVPTGERIWTTPGDRFVLDARDASGALVASVRMARPARTVTSADQEAYKAKLREGLERVRAMGIAPPGLIESEIKKIDETDFAPQMPAIGLLSIDRVGRLWVTAGTAGVDSVLTYAVFSSTGELLGRVVLPSGLLMGANADRVVVRREDEGSGLVRFEVWGLTKTQ